jgi:NitT/TauT family transport system substrate-binding protein
MSLGLFFFTLALASGAEKTDLKFATDFVFHGADAPFFVALGKGFWAERGLKVNVERGYGAADGVKRLVAGTNDLVFGDSGAAILARADGTKVKLVGVIYEKSPWTIFALKKRGISEPKHLEGKQIATFAGDINYVLFPVLARATGVDPKKVNWATVGPAERIPMFLAEKVDAMTGFITSNAPILDREAAKLGGYNKMSYADYGVDLYSNGITGIDKFVEENPGSVRGFVQATVKAYEFSFAQPEEAIQILVKAQPHLSPDVSRAVLEVMRGIVLTPAAKANGIGWVVEEKMRRTRDVILSAYGKKVEVPLQDIYTNRFLR